MVMFIAGSGSTTRSVEWEGWYLPPRTTTRESLGRASCRAKANSLIKLTAPNTGVNSTKESSGKP